MIAAKKLWKNDYFKTALIIGLIVAIVLGFFFGLQLALNTPYPALTVESGSMCVPYDGLCDGWSHPFAQTLHIGDIIIIQGVDPKDLNANYPNSDIIVFREPGDPNGKLVVHRIVEKYEINGTLYFQTKGDGNGPPWPAVPPVGEYDSYRLWGSGPYARQGVSQDQVVGRVVMRIPWFGHITLFMRRDPWGLPIIIALILLLVIIEFILPILRGKKKPTEPEQQV